MSVTRETAIVEDPRYREHRGPRGHPERPERLAAVSGAIAERSDSLTPLSAREATPDEILRVHGSDHLRLVEAAARRGPTYLDPDTYVSAASFEVALLAAGAAVDLARQVARGAVRNGFAAVRPPGHHAESDRAMGFCLFNNVAIAAQALRAEEHVDRILILDWDVHHGNGTQHLFEDDPSTLYASTHQFPFYPGTGAATEVGVGRGAGATVNVPLPAGCGDAEYVGVFHRIIAPVTRSFRPDVILVSCGFDAHRDDPLAAMNVTEAGFRAMTRIVRALADELCDGRLALVLEGGYAETGLREGTRAVLGALLEEDAAAAETTPALEPNGALWDVVERVRQIHREHYPELGSA